MFAREPSLGVAEFKKVLIESGLAASRPVDDEARLKAMLAGSNLILTARMDQNDGTLVGVARCITDFTWCCYLSELAVSASAQGLGIGHGLLDVTRQHLGPQVSLFLVSVSAATGFYERAGMSRIADAFCFAREA